MQFLYAHGIRARANLLSKLIPAILVVNLEYGTLALFIYLDLFKGTLWRLHTRIVPAFDQLAVTADSHPLPLSMYVRQLSFLVFRARDMSWLSMVRGVGYPYTFTGKNINPQ